MVIGLGFVGTAVAANLARTRPGRRPAFLVIGLDQDNPAGRRKCAQLDRGKSPIYANDQSLEKVIHAACVRTRNLVGTVDASVLAHADTVVFCINLDLERKPGQTERLFVNTEGYARAMRQVGERIRPGTLVTVESTLPLGLCDQVLYPALCEGQARRGVDIQKHPPLLAFCYERVMPGPDYLQSVNNYWRAYAGVNAASSDRAEKFLSKYVNIRQYPLWRHKSTRAAEMSKLLENAYRATNIAFIEEWAKLAEQSGVDLFDVVASIRVRRGTHDNMMRPGLGVGGYCLTKDALLAAFGAENLVKVKAELPFSRRAILTNERMPLRAVEWIRAHFRGNLSGKRALLVGITYRPGVADTRSSPAETVARALLRERVKVTAYDPLIDRWDEVPEIPVTADLARAVKAKDIVVIGLPDSQYQRELRRRLVRELRPGAIVVDPWDLLGDAAVKALTDAGVVVKVYGRGDLPQVRK